MFCSLIVMHLRAVGSVVERLLVGEVAGEHCPDEDAERTQAHAERDQELNQRQGFHLRLPTCPPWLRARSRRRGARPRLHRRRWRPAASRQTPSTSLATAACTRSATPGPSAPGCPARRGPGGSTAPATPAQGR